MNQISWIEWNHELNKLFIDKYKNTLFVPFMLYKIKFVCDRRVFLCSEAVWVLGSCRYQYCSSASSGMSPPATWGQKISVDVTRSPNYRLMFPFYCSTLIHTTNNCSVTAINKSFSVWVWMVKQSKPHKQIDFRVTWQICWNNSTNMSWGF